MSGMCHFPVRLVSFLGLHSTFKMKSKYPVFTVIVTKVRRPDATHNANRLTHEVNSARLRKTMIKTRECGVLHYFNVYGPHH